MLEVEEISGAFEVSVPGWHPAATRHFMGAGTWHLLAWLSLLCLILTWPGVMGSFPSHHCFLLWLASVPVTGLGPGELRREGRCVALGQLACWH